MEAQLMVRTGGVAHRGTDDSLGAAVGRYLFGPPIPASAHSPVLAEIERLGGVVAPADVMRVTGLDRPAAESLLCRLAARHDGDVAVAGEAVVYRFPIRPRRRLAATPVWQQRREPEPLTGNERAVDLALLCFNLAVLVVSASIILLTLSVSSWAPAIALVPFQLAVLALSQPAARLFGRRAHLARVSAENGRRALLQAVLERSAGEPLGAHALSHVWICAAGRAITPRQLTDELSALGGEPDIDDEARLQFRFPDLDHEARALSALRS
jgi:hypothetical protein